MFHALTLALVLAQGGPSHADLHPANADFYLELADVSTVLPALDKTPMLRFLRDPRMKALLEMSGQSADRSLLDMAEQGIAQAKPVTHPEQWLRGLKTVSVSVEGLGKPATEGGPTVSFELIAELATPEQAKALNEALLASATAHEPMPGVLPGIEKIKGDEPPNDDLWSVVVGSRVVLGGGAAKVEDYVARADGKSAGFGRDEKFKKQLGMLEKPTGTPLLWFALTRPLQEVMREIEPGDESVAFLEKVPADMNPFASPRVARMQLVGDRFVTEMFAGDTAAPDANAKAVDASWIEPVPSTSMFFFSTAFDGVAAGKRIRELLGKDEQSAATLAALEQKLGFGPERVLGRLGPAMTVYLAPLAGPGLPETHVWMDCEDPAAFQADFEALVNAFGETLPGFQAKTKPYKLKKAGSEEKIEVPITTLTLPPDMLQIPMISLSPSFSPVGKKLVFGLSSMDVKSELKRVHGGEGEAIVAGENALAKKGFALPAGSRAVFLMDWGKLLGSLVDITKAFAPMMGDTGFDFAKLPPSTMFSEFFKPTFHYSKAVPGGTYRRNEASFGPETWLGIVGAAAMIGARQSMGIGGPNALDQAEPPTPQSGNR